MPLQATSGAASYDAFGGGVPVVSNYIEDVFSTWLYTGTGASLTITNGIDLSGKGGLVWTKARSAALTGGHVLTDTVRGAGNLLRTQVTNGNENDITALSAFNSTGFTLGTNGGCNNSGTTFASWSFREQPKFFDVVTFTSDASNTNQRISHNLGSTPGCIFVKQTSGADGWFVWHRSYASATNNYQFLNTTAAVATSANIWGSTGPSSTDFGINTTVFGGSATFVAYIFAHGAGGFGLTGTDNVISCGNYSGNGSNTGPITTLGYEPQWILIKRATGGTGNWFLVDNMRGLTVESNSDPELIPNTTGAENSYFAGTAWIQPLATGFQLTDNDAAINASGSTYIYIAIRRGPMKVPTSGTSVFSPVTRTGTGANATISGIPFAPDAIISTSRGVGAKGWLDKLRGKSFYVRSNLTDAEVTTTTNIVLSYTNTGVNVGPDTTIGLINYPDFNFITYFLQRAPSFFDEVCYTGTGVARTLTHNLGIAPELVIYKNRSGVAAWAVQSSSLPSVTGSILQLESTNAVATVANYYTTPTSTTIGFGSGAPTDGSINNSGATYVAYLFATCAGVSKVGSYTGTATTLQINCGFTAGARFVMIKRTDSTGDWYFWDSARGIIAGNDPYLLMNSSATEVTNTDYVDTYSAGFEISSTAPAAINASGGTFIFLAIA